MKHKRSILLFFYVIACLAWNASASIEQQIESLINQLSDEDGVVRRNATLNLVRIGNSAVPELVRVLPQADFQLRFAVVDTLNQMAPADALGAVPALMATLRQPNFIDYSELGGREFHGLIAETLAAIGSPAAGPLVEALNDVNEDTRYYVVWALEWMGSEAQAAVPALIQLLKDKDDGVRQAAASVLGTTAQPNVADIMLPPLEDLLTPRRKPALSQANHPAQPAVPTLIKMLGDEDENDSVHVAAARTLGRIGDVTAVPVLITSLNDRNDRVRSTAATALGEIGNSAQTAVPTLINMLKIEAHDKVRRDVVLGLAGIGTPDALNALIKVIFNDESSLVRKEAVLGLGRIDEPDDIILPLMITSFMIALEDPDPHVRVIGSKALAKIGEPAVPALSLALSNKILEVRKWSAFALSLIGAAAQAAEPRLIVALKDGDKDVRRYAARALKKIGTPEAIKAAEPVLEKDDKPIIINVRRPSRD